MNAKPAQMVAVSSWIGSRTLGEARAILAGLEQALVEGQAAEFITQAQRCFRCGRPRACKGHHRIVFRTPFGKLALDSPQRYGCPCQSPGPKSVSRLAELLPPAHLARVGVPGDKIRRLSLKLLEEVLPIGQHLNSRTTRRQVHQAAERLEAERAAQGPDAFLQALPPNEKAPSTPATPLGVGLDGGYVHTAGQRSRTEWWFEVIVGKSLAAKGPPGEVFRLGEPLRASSPNGGYRRGSMARLAGRPARHVPFGRRRHRP